MMANGLLKQKDQEGLREASESFREGKRMTPHLKLLENDTSYKAYRECSRGNACIIAYSTLCILFYQKKNSLYFVLRRNFKKV